MIALSLTLDDLLFLHEESELDRTAVVFRERQASYRELIAEVEILAGRLLTLGVQRGDRVVVHLAKSCEEIVAMFACWRIGAVAVNVNVQWTLAQLDYVLEDSGARVLLADARRASEIAAGGLRKPERVIVKG
ncbi:MAG TPA: AMP-binding protein, partial [Polyangiales bacterium]|nr:AMP-binding protein [Polyangiales bacterium]